MKNSFIQFKLPVSIIKESKKFVAYSPALDLSTSGNSIKQAQSRFEEAVDIFFEEIIEKGTLSKVLTNLGWKQIKMKWTPPTIVEQKNQNVKVRVNAC